MPDWDLPDEIQTFSVGSITSITDEEDDYVPRKKKIPFGFRAPEIDANQTDKPMDRKRRRKVHHDKRIRQKGRNGSNGSGNSGAGTGKIS